MKTKSLCSFLAGCASVVLAGLPAARAADAPRGSLLELHSCQVYAGPCVINSESPQEGRYMMRAWDFDSGSFHGVSLAGLKLAVLQVSTDNLAAKSSRSGNAIIYLPEAASPAQRDALQAWLKMQPDFAPATIRRRVVPLNFSKTRAGYAFSAGKFIHVSTTPLTRCTIVGCGDVLWYHPRSTTSVFTVAVDNGSRISEPLLKLKWTDADTRNIFLARFGEPTPVQNRYISLAELCGAGAGLF